MSRAMRVLSFGACAIAVFGLAACPSTTGPKPNGGEPDPKAAETPADPRERYKVADTGQTAAVEGLFKALNAGDVAALKAVTTQYAQTEMTNLFSSVEEYVRVSKLALGGAAPKAKPAYPWRRPDDGDGSFLEVSFRAPGAKDDRFVAVYLVPSGGTFKVDNVLTAGLLDASLSAPAFGFGVPNPLQAFKAYYWGAMFAEHPVNRDRSGTGETPTVTVRERMTYLRNSCGSAFIESMKKQPDWQGDFVKFLDTGRSTMRQHYRGFEVVSGGENFVVVEIVPVPGNREWQPLRLRFDTERVHGQCRLVRQSDAPLEEPTEKPTRVIKGSQ